MKKFEWKAKIQSNIFALKLLGLWPEGDESYKLNLYSLYSFFCIVILDCGHNLFQNINIYFIINDLEAFSQCFFVIVASSGTILKCYSLVRNMKNLKQIFLTLSEEDFQPRNESQQKMVEPSIKWWRRMYLVFRISCYSTATFWTIYPIMDGSYKEKSLPFLAWYPYDEKIYPYYHLTYVYQVVAIWFIVAASLNTDCLIAALNMFIGAQCDLLCDNLKNLEPENDEEMKKKLVECIKHHAAILRLAETSNKFYNWIVLCQFFSSNISLAFAVFQLTLVAPFTSQFYSFIFYVISMVVEIFIYCWFGNEVEIKSSQIPYAAFQCDWNGRSVEIQKILIIFTIRTLRPIKMSALNLFYLSVDTFKAILRTSWSYFTVLRQASSN